MSPLTLNRMRRGPEVDPPVADRRDVPPPAAHGPSDSVIAVDDLAVTFERGGSPVQALRGVSLGLAPGEAVGLVGESGSGKSVLGLTLLGLLPRQPAPAVTGRALVCGTDMVTASEDVRRQVRRLHLGAVFQDPMTSLNPTMRIGRQVAEAAGSEEEALGLLDAVGIPEARQRFRAYPHELSGGQRQRVMIAMAVAGSPSLLIADEPTTALDVTVQAQILRLLRQLCDERSMSLLMITHDLGVASEVADRIAVLYAGRLAEEGPAGHLFRAPRHPYSIGLLRSRLELTTDRSRPLAAIPGEPPDPRDPPPGCAFAPRCALRIDECEQSRPEPAPVPDTDHAVGPGRAPESGPSRRAACIRIGVTAGASGAVPLAPLWPEGGGTGRRPPTAVVVNGVTKSFPGRGRHRRERLQALAGIDLEVLEGEAVALVGESGCGKSTLLRVMAGLTDPDGGSVEFGRGENAQLVFQDAGASLTPWLTVSELVGERLRGRGMKAPERDAEVAAMLAQVGLPAEVARAKAAQLSGGQRQRVALARAVVVPPQVLLCDEPTSALDVSLAATVLNLIGRLRRQLDMAVVFVTHDLGAARIVADRIAVMHGGRIVETGPAEQVCSRPADAYTAALIAAVPGRTGLCMPGGPDGGS